MFKKRLCSFLAVIVAAVLSFGVTTGTAATFNFQWNANHLNDEVKAYRIYWSTTVGSYLIGQSKYIPIDPADPDFDSGIVMVKDGITSSISTFPHDADQYRYTLDEASLEEGSSYFFVATAIDSDGFESIYSDIKKHMSSISYSNPLNPHELMQWSAILELEKKIEKLKKEIEDK